MLLNVEDLSGGYHKKKVLNEISAQVERGEMVSIIGHNGAGKTTFLKTIFGMLKPTGGKITFDDHTTTGQNPGANVALGMAMVPQERAVFPNLNVVDNLNLAAFSLRDKEKTKALVEEVIQLFPILGQRASQLAGTMSGGQQRMLAVGIALMQAPKLLMLDEPSLGLAPVVVGDLMEQVHKINQKLGTAIVLVEQNVKSALENTSRIYVMKLGSIVYQGAPEPLEDRTYLMELF